MITLHYQARFGLARGAVYYNGLPQLYEEGYEHDSSLGLLGVCSVARLATRSGSMAFLTLADDQQAVLEGAPDVLARLPEGMAVEVEIIAEARGRGRKLARARFIAASAAGPGRLSPVMSLRDRLLTRSVHLLGEKVVKLAADADALDEARDRAVDPSGPLSNGGHLMIEPTQAVIACDIDSAAVAQGMAQTSKTVAKACNELAVADLGRRLRLSNQAGHVVVDLIGRRHDGKRLVQLLAAGFTAEAPRIITAPIGKFSTLEFVRPWGAAPLADGFKPEGHALYRLNQAIALADQDRGRVIVLRDRAPVIDVLRPLLANALDPLAPMLRLEVSDRPEVKPL